jgi:hypothetical protein
LAVSIRATALLGSEWRLDRRQMILAVLSALGLMVLADLTLLHTVAALPGLVSDFFAFWSFAEFVHVHVPAEIYDPSALHQFQAALGVDTTLPFLYPPSALLVFAPLRLLPYAVSFGAWVAATLAICTASLCRRTGWI